MSVESSAEVFVESSRDNPVFSANGSLLLGLTKQNKLLLFSYSPERELLLSITGNVHNVLGIPEAAVLQGANLFLRHMHEADRFVLLPRFEAALAGESPFFTSYRWLKPDDKRMIHILCRAEIRQDEYGMRSFDGILLDITDLPFHADEQGSPTSSLLALLPHPALLIDRDYWITAHNFHERPLADLQMTLAGTPLDITELRVGANLIEHPAHTELAGERKKIFASLFDQTRPQYEERSLHHGRTLETQCLPFSTAHGKILGIAISVRDVSTQAALEHQSEMFLAARQRAHICASISLRLRNVLQSSLGQLSLLEQQRTKSQRKTLHDALIKSLTDAALLSEKILENQRSPQEEEFVSDLNFACMNALSKLEKFFARGVKVALNFGSPPRIRISEESFVQAFIRVVQFLYEQCGDSLQMSLSTGLRLAVGRELGKQAQAPAEHAHDAQVHIVVRARKSAALHSSSAGSSSAARLPTESLQSLSLSSLREPLRKEKIELVEHGSRSGKQALVYSFSLMIPAVFMEDEEQEKTRSRKKSKPRVLVVDDDPLVRETATKLIERAGFPSVSASDARTAHALAHKFAGTLQAVLLDAFLPGEDGVELLRKLKKDFPKLRVIGFTGASAQARKALLNEGADEVLAKPMQAKRILECVQRFASRKSKM